MIRTVGADLRTLDPRMAFLPPPVVGADRKRVKVGCKGKIDRL